MKKNQAEFKHYQKLILENQKKKVLANQETILANQEKMLAKK
jgi:hypothetical protein